MLIEIYLSEKERKLFFIQERNMEKTNYKDIKWKENGKLKLLIIVGTRPEIIRLAAVINKTRKYFDVILAHTGQNYD